MITIIAYDNKYQPAFKRLNLEWLDKYNLTESHDLEILDDPDGTVIAGGGRIFLAMDDNKVIGTAGLWKQKAKKIFLYSNSQLQTALKLYEKYGFRHVPVTGAPFVTADVKMELIL